MLAAMLLLLASCGPGKRMGHMASVADAVWTYSLTHPDGFTLELTTMTEPARGLCVAYEATQSSHSRSSLDAVVAHAAAHDGFVGGWMDARDSLYYFDSVRVFPEDSLAAALRFGRAQHQKALFRLSTGEEILCELF